jgi:hypothetical protein
MENTNVKIKQPMASFEDLAILPLTMWHIVRHYSILTPFEKACSFFRNQKFPYRIRQPDVNPGELDLELIIRIELTSNSLTSFYFQNHFLLIALASTTPRIRYKLCDMETFVNWLLERRLHYLFPHSKTTFLDLQDLLYNKIFLEEDQLRQSSLFGTDLRCVSSDAPS